MGVLGLLGIVFIVLKLTGVILWPWYLVLLPFIVLAIGNVLVGVVALGLWRYYKK